MKREYKNVIFTDHALQQMRKRRISRDMVATAVNKPDHKEPEEDDKVRFVKEIKDRNVMVVAMWVPAQKKHRIVTAWVRGEEDPKPFIVQVLLFPFRLLRLTLRVLAIILGGVFGAVRGLVRMVGKRGEKSTAKQSAKRADAPKPQTSRRSSLR